jgi:hypothetical protein
MYKLNNDLQIIASDLLNEVEARRRESQSQEPIHSPLQGYYYITILHHYDHEHDQKLELQHLLDPV